MAPISGTPLAGEMVWITGASSGIGKELALQMAAAGAQVIASGRSRSELVALEAQHSGIRGLVFDVTKPDNLGSVGKRLGALVPHLNRVVINAGTCEYFDLNTPDWEMMERVMRVNYLGAVKTLSVALPLLRRCPAANGHVVAVASMATFLPFSRAEAYGASKAALHYFMDSLRVDLQPEGIDVTVINPGFIKTPLTDKNDFPMPFLMEVSPAVSCMLKAMLRRPRQFDFPGRLKWMLVAFNCLPGLWYGLVSSRLQRS